MSGEQVQSFMGWDGHPGKALHNADAMANAWLAERYHSEDPFVWLATHTQMTQASGLWVYTITITYRGSV